MIKYSILLAILFVKLTTIFQVIETKDKKKHIQAVSKINLDLNQNLEIEFNKESIETFSSLNNFLSDSVLEFLELGKAIPGQPGVDYPILGSIPYTNFYCDEQKYPGFFADMETRCQTWHYCDIDGRQTTFLCPNGTLFNQVVFICDWWFNVECNLSNKLYVINSRLYGKRKKSKKSIENHRAITKELLENIFQ